MWDTGFSGQKTYAMLDMEIFLPEDAPLISLEEQLRELDREEMAALERDVEYQRWLDKMNTIEYTNDLQ